jgi:hypothetical protein
MRRSVTAAGINVQHIPFRGPVEAFTEVMTGRIDSIICQSRPRFPTSGTGRWRLRTKRAEWSPEPLDPEVVGTVTDPER